MKNYMISPLLAILLLVADSSSAQNYQFQKGKINPIPPLPPKGLHLTRLGYEWNDLSDSQRRAMFHYFNQNVLPRWPRVTQDKCVTFFTWVDTLKTKHKINEYAAVMADPKYRAKFKVDLYVATNGNDQTGDGSQQRPYATIQKAIDIAKTGQVIGVLPGTYQGVGNRDINLNRKGVVIRSLAGPHHTALDCGRHRILQAVNNEPVGTKLIGFTIRNGFIQFRGIGRPLAD